MFDVLADATQPIPQHIHPAIAGIVTQSRSDNTAFQQMDKLARAFLAVNPEMNAVDAFRVPVEQLEVEHIKAVESAIQPVRLWGVDEELDA